jgi:microcystin-dependent protein
VAYGGTSTPEGWLMCDGTSYPQSTYPDLFVAIGIAYGTVDGTHFNVPDFRGQFLRGVANGSTNDPDRAARTAMNTGGNTGNNVGSVQANTFKSHTHTFYTGMAGGGTLIPNSGGSMGVEYATSATGELETRPINAYVNYIIKY